MVPGENDTTATNKVSRIARSLKKIEGKLLGTALSVPMGFLSNLLHWADNALQDTAWGDKLLNSVCFAILEFQEDLRDLADKSDNDLDDQAVEELIEYAKEVLDEAGYPYPTPA